MSTIEAPVVGTLDSTASEGRVEFAARHLYDAEVALHAARQTGVDKWVAAAYDRLHEAVIDHSIAVALHDH